MGSLVKIVVLCLLISGQLFSQELKLIGDRIIDVNNINHSIQDVLEDDKGRLWVIGLKPQGYTYHDGRKLVFGFYDGEEFFYKKIPDFGVYYKDLRVTLNKFGKNKILIFSFSPKALMIYDIKSETTKTLFRSDYTYIPLNYSCSGDTIFYSKYSFKKNTNEISIYRYLHGESEKLFTIPYVNNLSLRMLKYEGEFFISYAQHSSRYSSEGKLLNEYKCKDFESIKYFNNSVNISPGGRMLYSIKVVNDTFFVNQSNTQPSLHYYNPEDNRFYIYDRVPLHRYQYEIFADKKGNYLLWYNHEGEPKELLLAIQNQPIIDLTDKILLDNNIKVFRSNDFSTYFWVVDLKGVIKYELTRNPENIILDNKSIRNIIPINDNRLLITTERSGWYLYNIDNYELKSIYKDKNSMINSTRGIYFIHDSLIISNNLDKIIRLNKQWGFKSVAQLNSLPESSLLFNDSLVIYGFSDGTLQSYNIRKDEVYDLWIILNTGPLHNLGVIHNIKKFNDRAVILACDKGLYLYDIMSQHIITQDTSMGTVMTMTKHEGEFYIGTSNGDFIKLKVNNEEFELDSILNVPSSIATITFDENHRVWIATFYGLYFLNTLPAELRQYAMSKLSYFEFNRFSQYYDSTSGLVFLGTVNGLNIINPADISFKDVDFTIYLTQYQFYDSDDQLVTRKTAPSQGKYIQIPVGNHYISIDYRSDLNFHDAGLTYEYKLDKSDWVNVYYNKQITFHNLPTGKHKLLIRSKSGSGNLSENFITLDILVHEAIYFRTWFTILCAFLIAGFIFLWIRRILTENKRMESEVRLRTQKIQEDKSTIEKQAGELQELYKAKDQFFTNISHELKTPLTLIYSPLKSILKKDGLRPELKSKIERINKNVNTLKSRIEELLELAKMKKGEPRLNSQIFNLEDSMQDIVDVFIDVAEEKKITYNTVLDLPDIMVKSDKKKLVKIFQNLINNAIKFTPIDGTVDVYARWENDELFFKIEDNGLGIPESEQERIFDKFYQLENPNDSYNLGTGIGLSLVKRFVHMMGGDIKLKSTLDEGTVFTVTIPLTMISEVKEDYELSETSGSYIPDETVIDSTILVVEDNLELREYVTSIIIPYFQSVEAGNGRQALDALEENHIDMIISDIKMPEMDGITFLEKLKENNQFKDIPILFLTANTNVRMRIQSFTLGVNDYMTKPFEEHELLIRITNLLKNNENRIKYPIGVTDVYEAEVGGNDKLTIQQIQRTIFENLTHPEFSVGFLAEQFDVHSKTLTRYTKQETGLTPSELITEARLIKAKELLDSQKTSSVMETVEQVGLKNQSYFSRKFKERFGYNPSSLLQ